MEFALISALLIAVVQGLTEWIPVSSSGHLVVFERIFSYSGGLMFDVALHFGTLMAVFVYFGKDVVGIVEDFLRRDWKSDNVRLGGMLVVATIPAVIVGFLFRGLFEVAFTSLSVVALGFGVTGIALFIGSLDLMGKGKISYGRAFWIGCAQVLALFPGISRSGVTMSSGMMFGLKANDAVKFSFLMSIPVIFGANILVVGNNRLPSELIWAALVAFFVGLLTIHILYKFILTSKKRLRWFGVYCLLLALGVGGYLLI